MAIGSSTSWPRSPEVDVIQKRHILSDGRTVDPTILGSLLNKGFMPNGSSDFEIIPYGPSFNIEHTLMYRLNIYSLETRFHTPSQNRYAILKKECSHVRISLS